MYKQRKNFDERPRFGTVSDQIFVPGEEGLLRGDNEDDEGNAVPDKAEWELKLNYGEEKE